VSNDKDNIILFPEARIVRKTQPKTVKEKEQEKINEKIKFKQYKEFIEGNVDEISVGLLHRLVDMGIRTTNENFLRDLAMMIDCMRGLIYRDFGMYHPAQTLTDKIVSLGISDNGPKKAKLEYSKVIKNAPSSKLGENIEEEVDNQQYDNMFDFEPDFNLNDNDDDDKS